MSAISVLSIRRWLRLALAPCLFVMVLFALLSLVNAGAAQGGEPPAPQDVGVAQPQGDSAPAARPSTPPAAVPPRVTAATLPPVASQSPESSLQAVWRAPASGRPKPRVGGYGWPSSGQQVQEVFARANTAWDAVDGRFGYPVTVQITVTDGLGALKGAGSGETGADGWLKGVGCNCDLAPGDHVEVRSSAGFEAMLEPIPIDGEIDVDADVVSGQMDKADFPGQGGVWVWSKARDEGSWLDLAIAADGAYAADFSGRFDIRYGDEAEVWYFDANDNWVGTMLHTPGVEAELWFNPWGHSNLWGRAEPGAALTITTAYTEVHLVADDDRNWNAPDIGPLQPGDGITVEVAGLPAVEMPAPDPFDAAADSTTDQVWGQIGGRYNKPVEVHAYWPDGDREVTTDASGHFVATYDDVPRGAEGYIRWVSNPAEYAWAVYHRPFRTLDLTLWVDYYHEDVYGWYEPGHTVWLTVTESNPPVIKATAVVSTVPDVGWGGYMGFAVQPGDWSPSRPDIQPGDRVFGRMDNGQTTDVRVGTITGEMDVDDDRVSGQIYAPWFTGTLSVDCHPWGGAPPNTPSKQSTAGPDGEPPYGCQWDPGTEWDLVPGNEVGVWYAGSDANWVGNGIREPAPNLHVETWPAGDGEAAAGGQAIFQILYLNQGDSAGDAVLTDTLPAGAIYVADSSGYAHVLLDDKVVWDLGSVQPMTVPHQFQLVVRNTSAVSDTLHNVVDIAATYDVDWNDNHAEAEVHAGGGAPDLYVNADANPGDPTPGQRFRYTIHFGNNGPVASGRACLTETLPAGATFVSLEQPENFGLWEPVSSAGGVLEFCAASVPGKWGGQLSLNLRLDAGVDYDTQLVNRVEIGTAGDSDPGNDLHVNDWTYTRPPRTESTVHKWWGHGSLAAGGEANYWLEYRNEGNVPLYGLVLTDTLPAGTTFITSVLDLGWGVQPPFPPTEISGRQLVWRIGDLDVNQGREFQLRLRIDPGTQPGAPLPNCATVTASAPEADPYNNTSCAGEAARPAGPNLRVQKFTWWEGQNRFYSGARIGNIGTTTETGVVVTETFPSGLTPGDWSLDFGEPWSWKQEGDQLIVTLSRVTPASTIWLHLWFDPPEAPSGTFYTDTAEITIPIGDVNPADNRETGGAATGPDLSIEKWQSGGPARPAPGDEITYTLHLENHSPAWGTQGNVCITDTLPAGVEFVRMLRWNCWPDLCQEDPLVSPEGVLRWCISPWGPDNWDDLFVGVRVKDAVRPGATLVNRAVIYSDNPDDLEPEYGDNAGSASVRAAGASCYLPMVLR